MKIKKILPYKISRAFPILGLAAGSLLSSCEKPRPEPQDVYFSFYEINQFGNRSEKHYEELDKKTLLTTIYDENVRHVYLKVEPWNDYTYYDSYSSLSSLRYDLGRIIEIKPEKVSGTGDFHFFPGVVSKEDSLWFVKNGWTVNQTPIAPNPNKAKQR